MSNSSSTSRWEMSHSVFRSVTFFVSLSILFLSVFLSLIQSSRFPFRQLVRKIVSRMKFLPLCSHQKTPVWPMGIKSWLEVPHVNSSLNKHWYKLTIFRETWAGTTSCERISKQITQHLEQLLNKILPVLQICLKVFSSGVERIRNKIPFRSSSTLTSLRC